LDGEIKLSCRNVWKVYGDRPERFFNGGEGAVADAAAHAREIRETGHIVAAADVSFDVRVGEIFVIMGLSGSGKSTVVRCLSRLVEPTAGHVLLDGNDLLALATVALAAIGALAAHHFRVLVGYLVIASAGTLLLAVSLGARETVAAGLFYLVNSTLVVAVLYLLVDRIDAQRGGVADQLVPAPFGPERPVLGALYFIAAIAACGLPPLAGFLGKALLLSAAWDTSYAGWVWAIVLSSSLAIIISMARAGSRVFWKPALPTSEPLTRTVATAPAQLVAVGFLFGALFLNTTSAGGLATYMNATAEQLFERRPYIDAVLGARPVPPALPIREIVGDKPKDKR